MIDVKLKSQSGTSYEPGKVSIFENGKLVASVTATVEFEPGADGGPYSCVKLTLDKVTPQEKDNQSEFRRKIEKSIAGEC